MKFLEESVHESPYKLQPRKTTRTEPYLKNCAYDIKAHLDFFPNI